MSCCRCGTKPVLRCCSSPIRFPKRSSSAAAFCCCRRIPARSRPRSTACRAARKIPTKQQPSAAQFTTCCSPIRSRRSAMLQAVERPNIYCETLGPDQFGIIEKPLTLAEQIYNKVWLRKILILVVLALGWEIYGRWLDNPLLVPPFSAAMRALITDVANGTIPRRALSSIEVLLIGFATGTVLAGLLTVFAMSSGQGGLGWYIFESKNQLNIPEVFAGLLTIILIGLAVENVVFRFIETRTVQRWGMQT